jgi:hypothetical protein
MTRPIQRKFMQKITPFLWFDGNAEGAAKFYTSIFKKSKILNVARCGEDGERVVGRTRLCPDFGVTVEFERSPMDIHLSCTPRSVMELFPTIGMLARGIGFGQI